MKVSIITRHAIPNYGSVLQSYASQKTFEKLGYDAEILNYVRYDERGKQSVMTNCHMGKEGLKNKLKRAAYFCLQYPNSQKMLTSFQRFQKQYLRLSNTLYGSVEELERNLPDADIFVTGSDQVWGAIGGEEYDPAYFLSFVPADRHQIAFSASFGKTDLCKDLTDDLPRLLKNYSSILVREKSAVDIVAQHSDKTAKLILDPTLMLDSTEWDTLCEKTGMEGKDYIFVYQLHHNKDMEKYITRVQKETGLPVYRAHPSIFYALKPGNFVHLPTPGQFLSFIRHAKYMITDSFHGTVFSLIFNKQFVDILPETTGTRIISLLEMLGLEDRLLTDMTDLSWMERSIDFTGVNEILRQEKEKTLKALVDSLPRKGASVAQMNLHQECCGCGACAGICPKHAITMVHDGDGFAIPHVHPDACIQCGICYNKCPQKSKKEEISFEQKGYAARMKNTDALKKSASGGIFYQAATEILSRGGAVYGAALLEDMSVKHIRVAEPSRLSMLQGSKYVQSEAYHCYPDVLKDLAEGMQVLFSGTPCQVAGLQAFLRKDYPNLYTMDLICHGVPSQKLWHKALVYEGRKSPVVSYEFRNKEKRGWDVNIKQSHANGKAVYRSGKLDVFVKAFLDGDIYRECCYGCNYASLNRVADLTVGDFWGIEKELPKFHAYDGVSCVIVNSQRGESLFAAMEKELVCEGVALRQIVRHNHNLVAPTRRPAKRDRMYLDIDGKPFNKMDISRMHRFNLKHWISYRVPVSLKKTVKKLLKKG